MKLTDNLDMIAPEEKEDEEDTKCERCGGEDDVQGVGDYGDHHFNLCEHCRGDLC